ncbi:signal recognition particle-docking protein FtsY [Candidatus Magnetomorum sp. HK-1]|nr:signal recognition particle-docking protein FtsY [Candidatus Magnetomorum sp. HK-1]
MKWRNKKKQKENKKRRFFKRKTDKQEAIQDEEVIKPTVENSQTEIESIPDENTDAVEKDQLEISDVPTDSESPSTEPPKKQKKRVFKRLKERLKKSRKTMGSRFETWGKKKIDEELLESLEESLITADIGVETTMTIMDTLTDQIKKKIINTTLELKSAVLNELLQRLPESSPPESNIIYQPHVILVVGVNGVGKTTSIGKLASRLIEQEKKVIIGASDTFRAAAVEQLEIWAEKTGADIVRHKSNADPAAVAFDTVQAAVSRKADVAIIDTAGRLHTKKNLMEEIRKIRRSIGKKLSHAPHDVFLVLDATTGQNAISQTQLFHDALNITGIILTKLDGTAKGGIVVSISNTFDIPIRYIGIGEKTEDLQPFDSELFVRALIE